MCGTPARSRTMRTGAARPATASVPFVCGSVAGAGRGASRRQPAAASAISSTTLRRMAIKDGLLAEFDHETATTRKLLERLPDDRLAWTPHDRSMTFGALATHITELPRWADAILNQTRFDLAAMPAAAPPAGSRSAILAAFDAHVTTARAMLDRTDAELSAYWTLRRGDQEIFTMPRATAFRT